LLIGTERIALDIVADSTDGLLRSGALVLDLSAIPASPKNLAIELRSPKGFERPPRLLRIEPNVVPIVQGYSIRRELHVANGMPDWSFQLDIPGLRFKASESPVEIEIDDAEGRKQWRRCDRLSDSGPGDRVYELDVAADRITFGNGINGRIPAGQAQVRVNYAVSDGEQGGVARNRKWKVAGFGGAFGVNPDPVAGGAAPSDWIDQRREARRRARDDHALVSSGDIVAAALALPLLEVARAWVLAPSDRTPRTGAVTLVAMRGRSAGKEPDSIPETTRWLDAIRRRLVARMPLATRLVVTAPRYVGFFVRATLEAAPGRDPRTIREAVEKELQKRLELVASGANAAPRKPGVPLSRRDVTAWMRAVDGVQRVLAFDLVPESGPGVDEIAVPHDGLPRFDLARTTIEVNRSPSGAVP
jgi:predicted phage baseplate assembly protein